MNVTQEQIDKAWSEYQAAMTQLRKGLTKSDGGDKWELKAAEACKILVRAGVLMAVKKKYR